MVFWGEHLKDYISVEQHFFFVFLRCIYNFLLGYEILQMVAINKWIAQLIGYLYSRYKDKDREGK